MTAERQRVSPYVVLAAGVLAVSAAAVLIRLADAPPLTVSFYRMAIAAAVVVPIGLWKASGALRGIGRRDWALLGASAVFLAMHFGFWIASLSYTSVASSVLIVTANPFLVAIASAVLLKEAVPVRVYAGIALGLAGGAIIGWGDFSLGGRALFGDVLAVLGLVGITGYYTIGRGLRSRLSLLAYITPVYSGATLVLLAAVLIAGSPLTGFAPESYGFLLLVGLVPQVVGHSALNWALGYLPAPLVATAVMFEPIGAAVLAWSALGEAPSPWALGGGALILAGVYLALVRGHKVV